MPAAGPVACVAADTQFSRRNVLRHAQSWRASRMTLETAKRGCSGIERPETEVLAVAMSRRRTRGFCRGVVTQTVFDVRVAVMADIGDCLASGSELPLTRSPR